MAVYVKKMVRDLIFQSRRQKKIFKINIISKYVFLSFRTSSQHLVVRARSDHLTTSLRGKIRIAFSFHAYNFQQTHQTCFVKILFQVWAGIYVSSSSEVNYCFAALLSSKYLFTFPINVDRSASVNRKCN